MLRRSQPLRVAIDTGGTFTDCVWLDHGHIRMLKVFSTPADPRRPSSKPSAKSATKAR
jgi:N-methylhydantoinase A/oxoprolinase/acetone carboxylase beta subunit